MSTKAAALDPRTILQMFAGGALLGGGTAAGLSLYRRLKALNEEAQRSRDTSYDDDTLYLDLPRQRLQKQAAQGDNAGTFALGSLGAATGAYTAYNLVRDIYERAEKKRLQRQLDQAQQVYLGNLTEQADLQKGAGFGMVTKGVGSLYLLAMLTALGSGVATNHILKKQFPAHTSPTRGKPKKLVLRSVDGPGGQNPQVEDVEEASQLEPEAMESVLQTHMSNPKRAAHSGFADLVGAVADGRADEIKDTLLKFANAPGHPDMPNAIDLVFALVKGAADCKAGPVKQALAATWICHDPLVSSTFAPVLAAEFYEMAPTMCKNAGYMDEPVQDALLKLAVTVTALRRNKALEPVRRLLPNIKSASEMFDFDPIQRMVLADNLKSLMETQEPEAGAESDGKRKVHPGDAGSSPTSALSPADPAKPHLEIQDAEAKSMADRLKPVLDNIVKRI